MESFVSYPPNTMLDGLAEVTPELTYATPDGEPQVLRVIHPFTNDRNRNRRYPLIVYTEGVGWSKPRINFNLPQLCRLAREGFAVATVTHRDVWDGHPFPAFLSDVKAAIRYLREHADEYCIDPERVCAMGNSAGGNASLLCALTGDDPRYRTPDYPDRSDAVQTVVAICAPADLLALYRTEPVNESLQELIRRLLGGDPESCRENAVSMSPLFQVRDGRVSQPFLIIHGDRDTLVPYESQGKAMFDRLKQAGADVRMIRIEGTGHSFELYTDQVFQEIVAFLKKKLGSWAVAD